MGYDNRMRLMQIKKKIRKALDKRLKRCSNGPPKNEKFYGGADMTKNFRFTVEIKAQVHDSPKGVESKEIFERVRQLAQNIAADEGMLIEIYKIIFLDLLLGDHYTEEINRRIKPKPEKELIIPAASKMAPQDSEFFTQLFPGNSEEALRVDKDDVLNLFYSQFGHPKIAEVCFESSDKNGMEKETIETGDS
jgi:hypothetical protein